MVEEISYEECTDLCQLDKLDESILIKALRARYERDDTQIYTWIGPVLVSINPYKQLPIYTAEHITLHRSLASQNEGRPLEQPHVFATAAAAYQDVLFNYRSQSVMISGESGAGKTEASKRVLAYLAQASTQNGTGDLERQIVAATPLLEAFGNAKTVRNNNSSRFGKFTKVHFSRQGKIVGASIETYLLEKVRVVRVEEGHRNFHIFYHLLAGVPPNVAKQLGLDGGADSFRILKSKSSKVEGIDDLQGFESVAQALTTFGLEDEQCHDVFRTLAAILHLGNVEFEPKEKGTTSPVRCSEPHGLRSANMAAALIGLHGPELEAALCSRMVGAETRASVYKVPLTVTQAEDVRDALAKSLYASLFDWLVEQINVCWRQKWQRNSFDIGALMDGRDDAAATPDEAFVGVLDIFGFEVFEHNSFEQLCINYANEKLHQQFINSMFKAEQQAYEEEGIGWDSVTFNDNEPTLLLIERPHTGLLAMIDEECLVPNGSERGLLEKLMHRFKEHPSFVGAGKPQRGKRNASKKMSSSLSTSTQIAASKFGIQHFAEPVTYVVDEWLDKNRDRVPPDLLMAMMDCDNQFVKNLFGGGAAVAPDLSTAPDTAATNRRAHAATNARMQRRPVADDIGTMPHRRAHATISSAGVSGAAGGGLKKSSVGARFKQQLASLYNVLSTSQPHYIRCVKPNDVQRADTFDVDFSSRQLSYLGLLETVRIRRAGYALRLPFAAFLSEYAPVLPPIGAADLSNVEEARTACIEALTKYTESDATAASTDAANVSGSASTSKAFCAGHKRIFIAERLAVRLDAARAFAINSGVVLLQAAARAMIARKQYVAMQAEYQAALREEARRRAEEEARRRAEEEARRRAEEEAKKRAEEEARRKAEEEKRRLEEEARRREEEARRVAEEARRAAEEEARRIAEERARQEAEALRIAQEKAEATARAERERKEAERKRKEEAIAAERRRLEEEARQLAVASNEAGHYLMIPDNLVPSSNGVGAATASTGKSNGEPTALRQYMVIPDSPAVVAAAQAAEARSASPAQYGQIPGDESKAKGALSGLQALPPKKSDGGYGQVPSNTMYERDLMADLDLALAGNTTETLDSTLDSYNFPTYVPPPPESDSEAEGEVPDEFVGTVRRRATADTPPMRVPDTTARTVTNGAAPKKKRPLPQAPQKKSREQRRSVNHSSLQRSRDFAADASSMSTTSSNGSGGTNSRINLSANRTRRRRTHRSNTRSTKRHSVMSTMSIRASMLVDGQPLRFSLQDDDIAEALQQFQDSAPVSASAPRRSRTMSDPNASLRVPRGGGGGGVGVSPRRGSNAVPVAADAVKGGVSRAAMEGKAFEVRSSVIRCIRCHRPCRDVVQLYEGPCHRKCFKCCVCKAPFRGGEQYSYLEGKGFACEDHRYALLE